MYGYYAMATGAVSHQGATSSVRRNMPDSILVMSWPSWPWTRVPGVFSLAPPCRKTRCGAPSLCRKTRVCVHAGPRTARARQAVLRAPWVHGVAAPYDLDAAAEHRQSLRCPADWADRQYQPLFLEGRPTVLAQSGVMRVAAALAELDEKPTPEVMNHSTIFSVEG